MSKKYTITKAEMATDIGDKLNPRLTAFEIDGPEEMQVSDGYHTMDELYDHRITLFVTICRIASQFKSYFKSGGVKTAIEQDVFQIWRSKRHSDGELCFGTGTQFVIGMGKEKGQQISYHLPIERWEETNFAETLEMAPEWDGHTSADVLERLKNL